LPGISTVASAPVPSGSICANESRVPSLGCPLEPTQIAPEFRTIGNSAAASPPATGSSAWTRATRLETTTTLTGTPPHFGVWVTAAERLCSAFVMQCSEAAQISGIFLQLQGAGRACSEGLWQIRS
jgi:hypothetical protein